MRPKRPFVGLFNSGKKMNPGEGSRGPLFLSVSLWIEASRAERDQKLKHRTGSNGSVATSQDQQPNKMPKQESTTIVVKTQGVDITVETKPKKTLTEEHKAKMAAGRKASREARERRKAASESDNDEDPGSTSPTKSQLQQLVDEMEAEMEALQMRLTEAKKQLEEMESESEEELPRFKADGTLDRRYKASKQIARVDGGVDLRFKVSKKLLEKGIVGADGTLVKAE